MQFSVRSNRCRLIIILLSMAFIKLADGQEPTTVKVGEPAAATVDLPATVKPEETITFTLPLLSELPVPAEQAKMNAPVELKAQPPSALLVPPVNPLSSSVRSLNQDQGKPARTAATAPDELRGVAGALRELEGETVSQSPAFDAQPMPPFMCIPLGWGASCCFGLTWVWGQAA